MKKLHVRLSVEVSVPDKLFKEIVDEATQMNGTVLDTEVSWLKDFVDFDTAKPVFDEWDNGGYIPSEWLTYDAVDSGFYEADENGLRRKENTK